jgi:hypothetical protein
MSATDASPESAEARASALFQTMIVQQVNMALVCLGQMPGEGGQKTLDLDGARFFIGVLEMLEVKTKGNLNAREQTMLNQSLTSLRLAYVEVSNLAAKKAPPSTPAAAEQPAAPAASPAAGETSTAEDAESRKKFSKKY